LAHGDVHAFQLTGLIGPVSELRVFLYILRRGLAGAVYRIERQVQKKGPLSIVLCDQAANFVRKQERRVTFLEKRLAVT
jgi:hypothetical protein